MNDDWVDDWISWNAPSVAAPGSGKTEVVSDESDVICELHNHKLVGIADGFEYWRCQKCSDSFVIKQKGASDGDDTEAL